MLSMETRRLNAFERVLEGIGEINRYRTSRERAVLGSAIDRLSDAEQQDPEYFFAPYYLAVAEDLEGHTAKAAMRLAKLIDDLSDADPMLKFRVSLNLAVAQYHGYTRDNLQQSIATLEAILTTLESAIRLEPWEERYIRRRAEALLAQVYATAMIPDDLDAVIDPKTHGIAKEECDWISRCFERSTLFAHRVLGSRRWTATVAAQDYYNQNFAAVKQPRASLRRRFCGFLRRPDREANDQEIFALARHALGLAELYYTDFFCDPAEKIIRLSRALLDLQHGGNQFSRDPAKNRDLASCHLRLGAWRHRSTPPHAADALTDLNQARKLLNDVLRSPSAASGFAQFELGRVYRLMGSFDDAMTELQKTKNIDSPQRGVSDARVNREIRLVKEGSTAYP